jgi:hypothetical protein
VLAFRIGTVKNSKNFLWVSGPARVMMPVKPNRLSIAGKSSTPRRRSPFLVYDLTAIDTYLEESGEPRVNRRALAAIDFFDRYPVSTRQEWEALLLVNDLALDTLMTQAVHFLRCAPELVLRYCTPRRSRTNSMQATSGTVAVSSTS